MNYRGVFGTTQYYFGWGLVQQLPKLLVNYQKVAVITSQRASGLENVLEHMSGNMNIRHFLSVQANPDISNIEEVRAEVFTCDAIVGLGGGSVLDASKALSVIAPSIISAKQWLEVSVVPDDAPKLPLILLPTTSGTGSELSFGAILSDRSRQFKGGLRGSRLAADIALIDPELTVSLPKQLTAETGFDIATHAMESYLSRRTNNHARILSLQALKAVTTYLPIALENPTHRLARTELAYASSLMGLNLASVGTCLPHRLQYPIGGYWPHTSHPQGLAWIYPVWLSHIYSFATQDVQHLYLALGLPLPLSAQEAKRTMESWLDDLGFSNKVPEFFDPERLAKEVTGNIHADPLPNPEQHIVDIYKEMMSL